VVRLVLTDAGLVVSLEGRPHFCSKLSSFPRTAAAIYVLWSTFPLGCLLKLISWREFLVTCSWTSFSLIAVSHGIGVDVMVWIIVIMEIMMAGVSLGRTGVRGGFLVLVAVFFLEDLVVEA
jgi:hypothetical protein